MNLECCTALVTGGAVRIGRAICQALAQRGCNVVVHYWRSRRAAERLARELRGLGVRATCVGARLRSQSDCAGLLRRAWQCGGPVNVLINNAAAFHKDRLLDATETKLRAELEINTLAPIFLTRLFARRLLARAAGRTRLDNAPYPVGGSQPWILREGAAGPELAGKVVNLLDRRIAALEAGCLPYLLSKKALADFTRLAALELAPWIAVNGVAPGPVLAPAARGAAAKDMAGPVPLQRPVTPQDVAAAVVYLLEADAITGQIIFVDGGQRLCRTTALAAEGGSR